MSTLEVLGIFLGAIVVLPVGMLLGVYLFFLWLAGLNWIADKFDRLMCWLFRVD